MKYYNIINDKIELTDAGKDALNELGVTLKELVNYSDEKLSVRYWTGHKTYIEQAEEYYKQVQEIKEGKRESTDISSGCVNFDDCRIPIDDNSGVWGTSNATTNPDRMFCDSKERLEYRTQQHAQGRFPANLLVSDDVLNDGKIHHSVKSKKIHGEYGHSFKFGGGISSPENQYSDSGSNSRYFDIDFWFSETIKKLPPRVQKVFPYLLVPKSTKEEKNRGLGKGTGKNTYNIKCVACGKWQHNQGIDSDKYTCKCENPQWEEPTGNIHPTNKPIKLMSYLTILGSREGDIVYDPFLGSGTTAIAAHMLSRRFIGSEISKEYYEIAGKRIKAITAQLKLFH